MSVGQAVLVHGLQSRAELNGYAAVVLEVSERWRCQVIATGERIRLKPENVVFLDGVPADASSAPSRPPRTHLRASEFATLQAAVDAAPPEGAVVEIEKDYNEMLRVTKPVSLVGICSTEASDLDSAEKQRRKVPGVEIDFVTSHAGLVEIRNLQIGSMATWMRGAGIRVLDGSPVIANCTIGGMFAVRVDSFRTRSCPVLVGNRLEGRLGGIWWDGACWQPEKDKELDGMPLSPTVGGLPKFVKEVVDANIFSGDLQWCCCVDGGLQVLLSGGHVMPLETPGPDQEQRQAMAAEIKACGWFVHRPTLALMDRAHLIQEHAAWALLASEPENAVRLEVQARKTYSEAEQIRHYRDNGHLLPEDIDDCLQSLPAPQDVDTIDTSKLVEQLGYESPNEF